MANESNVPRFTDSQIAQLKKLDLCDEQIAELQDKVLRLGRSWLKPSPTLTEVREKINDISKASEKLAKLLNSITKLPCRGANFEVRERITIEYWNAGMTKDDDNPLPEFLEQVQRLQDMASNALSEMPTAQRRNNSTSYKPIEWIDNALLRGFWKKYENLGNPIPGYDIRVSSSPNTQFRKVVGICYEAITGKDFVDPERAIKNYINIRKAKK